MDPKTSLSKEQKTEGDTPPVVATLYVQEPIREGKGNAAVPGTVEKEREGATLRGKAFRERKIELREGETVRVGRSRSNDLAIRNKNVSRFHAVFSASSSGVLLSDLSSLNGTLVNGARINTPVDLNSEDLVTIGDTTMKVVLGYRDYGVEDSLLGCTQSSRLVSVVVTVLVVDVCGYTRLSEVLPATDVAQMMDRWFKRISDIVKTNGGEVDKYIGDCVMAIWRGGQDNSRELACQAVGAGREMLLATEKLSMSGRWPHQETYPWKCRVALNSGEALMGTVGGAGKRDFTVLGDAVNLVFRLEDVAGKLGTSFIFSGATARLVNEAFAVRDLGKIRVEGRSEEVEVYTLAEPDSVLGDCDLTGVSESGIKERTRKAEELIEKLEQKPIIAEIFQILGENLSASLTFHSLLHSRDVLRQAIIFALYDGKDEREVELLGVAAAYHDAGFLERREDNEILGANMAEEAMRSFGGYSEKEIELVKTMILDTKLIDTPTGMKQNARTRLSEYLLDADLSNFGREDFFDRMDALCHETGADRDEELLRTLEFMSNHEWCTDAATALRQERKEENMAELRQLIAFALKK